MCLCIGSISTCTLENSRFLLKLYVYQFIVRTNLILFLHILYLRYMYYYISSIACSILRACNLPALDLYDTRLQSGDLGVINRLYIVAAIMNHTQ